MIGEGVESCGYRAGMARMGRGRGRKEHELVVAKRAEHIGRLHWPVPQRMHRLAHRVQRACSDVTVDDTDGTQSERRERGFGC